MRADGATGAAGFPVGWRRHKEPHFGYAVSLPRRFVLLGNAVDPIALALRGEAVDEPEDEEEEGEEEEEALESGPWPQGFCDPAVLGDIGDGQQQPLRLLEFDVLGREEPMTEDQAGVMWFEVREAMPAALEALDLPGFRILDVRGARLGRLDALAFEYRWDGLSEDYEGGDRVLVVWAPTSRRVFHVYYHCPAELWDEWRPELDDILASFELLEPGDWSAWEKR